MFLNPPAKAKRLDRRSGGSLGNKIGPISIAIFTVLVLSMLPIFTFQAAPASANPSDNWPMFRGNLEHTGYTPAAGPTDNTLLWSYQTGSGVESSPAVADGRVYVGSYDGKVYCFSAYDNTLIWSYTTGDYVFSSPAVADGRVYVGSYDSKVYCFSAYDNTLIWSYQTGGEVWSSPSVADGRVYVGSDDGKVYCFSAYDNTLIWSYQTGSYVRSSPAVADGRVYVGSDDGKVYCFSAYDNTLIWSYQTGGKVWSSPSVADGRVYVGSCDYKVYCFKDNENILIWSYQTGGPVSYSSPAVAGGRVYVGSDDYNVYCFSAYDNTLIWSYTTAFYARSSPAVADDRVYVGSIIDYKVYCFNDNENTLIWSYQTGSNVLSSPAVADGRVYVGSWDGKVYCFGPALPAWGVSVSISPDYQSGLPGVTLNYTVTVKNTGGLEDNYDLTVSDNSGWGPTVSPTSLTVPAGENRTATLSVIVPTNAIGCTEDSITVTATSQSDSTVSDNDSCIAHAEVVYGVEVSILPEYQEGLIGETLNYTVTVTNTGNVDDNYNLKVVDNENWNPSIVSSIAVPAFENQMTTLTVTIPENAIGCLLTVTATSQGDNTKSDDDICIAHAFYVWQIDEAIDNGVAWLLTKQNPDGSWGSWYPVATTGLAVLKLAEHAVDAKYGYGLPSPFDPGNPYRENLENGLNYIFLWARVINIDNEPAGNPDNNGNGKGVYFSRWESHRIYETAIAMMAIAASRAPDRVVNVPGSAVENWKYKDVLQDAVEYLAWGQNDAGWERGGWGYEHNYVGWSDESNTGWPTFGLGFAESPAYGFMCTIPAFVKTELNIWIDYIQNDVNGDTNDGGAGYTSPDSWVNILKTGHLLYQMEFVGDTAENQRVQDAVAYLVRHWNDANDEPGWRGWPGGVAGYQAMYNVMKGLAGLGIHVIDGIDWQTEFEEVLLAQQLGDGSWPVTIWDRGYDKILSTELALLTLQKVVPPFRKVEVTISPDNQSGLPGVTLTYTVTVKNLGTIDDSYDLIVSGGVISPTVLTVPAGENRTATLRVTVPSGGTSTITVTARSRADPSVSDSASCTATAEVPPPAPPAPPEAPPAPPAAPPAPPAAPPKVPPPAAPTGPAAAPEVPLAIPWEIIMAGVLGVLLLLLVPPLRRKRGVKVSISPKSQTGTPGKRLSYTVTVKNTGRESDTYDLKVSGGAEWSPKLADGSLSIDAGKSKTTTLRVTVPSSAKEGDSTKITVTATSQADSSVSGSASCAAVSGHASR